LSLKTKRAAVATLNVLSAAKAWLGSLNSVTSYAEPKWSQRYRGQFPRTPEGCGCEILPDRMKWLLSKARLPTYLKRGSSQLLLRDHTGAHRPSGEGSLCNEND